MRRLSCCLAVLFLLSKPAGADGLPALNADPAQSSISGISSGAFMAVQFAVAWSSTITGVGVIAGGPYYCFEGNLVSFGLSAYAGVLPCMTGPPPDLGGMFDETSSLAARGAIDDPAHLSAMKVYLFHGFNDKVVATSVSDAARNYFLHYLGAAGSHHLFYQNSLGAGHSQPILDYPAAQGLNTCTENASPYMDQCNYDAAGVVLRHIYGALNRPDNGATTGEMRSFDQGLYTGPFHPDTDSLAEHGFVYLPQACLANAPCRVHIALHGCAQNKATIQRRYIDYAGYNRWADANNIVVLYPQTANSTITDASFGQYNPSGCWDWFAYLHHDDDYVTKSGRQIAAIKAMLDALTHGAPQPPAPGSATPPQGVDAIDASADAIDLVWRPTPGATGYRVERADGSGDFVISGMATGPSFGDGNLQPSTSYRYRVVALNPAGESAPSDVIVRATLARPAVCRDPGSCPYVPP